VRIVLLTSVAVVVALSTASSPSAGGQVLSRGGLSVVAPRSWHLAHEQLSDCLSPKQILAVTDVRGKLGIDRKLPRDRTLVMLLEGGPGKGFPARTQFRAPERLDQMGGCCETPLSRGFSVSFRDHGRNFYAFVYAADRSNAARATAVLNTLEVR
jgi:hypothetical protein